MSTRVAEIPHNDRPKISRCTDLNGLLEEYRMLAQDLTEVACELRDLSERSKRLIEADAREFVADRPEKTSIH